MARLVDTLQHKPTELSFGTSGLRGLAADMTDLECYINTTGFLTFLAEAEGYNPGDVVYVAGDLRDSTPRILRAVHQAVTDCGFRTVYCGLIPTPALAHFALKHNAPCIMVTGSHIPSDRNGIKFYKRYGEVLKEDEAGIIAAVSTIRYQQYDGDARASKFDGTGALRSAPVLPQEVTDAREAFVDRYVTVFGKDTFAGQDLVFYQHSAVGRDLLVDILTRLGATVTAVGRSDTFVPIDSENVTPSDQNYFRELARQHPTSFAIVSTDGDSDRPFVIDERGTFHRGDLVGAVVSRWLQADFAAYPVSANDAVDHFLEAQGIPFEHTRIGSPYVIAAIQTAVQRDKRRVMGWEVNGGFLVGGDVMVNGALLEALPTRDALLPIIVAILAARQQKVALSQLFATLPPRYTQAGLIDNFPVEISKEIVKRFSADTPGGRADLGIHFTAADGFGAISHIDGLDGVRVFFANGDIAHLRPSGNAPQLRIYSVADSQERADVIVQLALKDPDGIFRRLQNSLIQP